MYAATFTQPTFVYASFDGATRVLQATRGQFSHNGPRNAVIGVAITTSSRHIWLRATESIRVYDQSLFGLFNVI